MASASVKRGREEWEALVEKAGSGSSSPLKIESAEVKEYLETQRRRLDTAKTQFHHQVEPQEALRARPRKTNVADELQGGLSRANQDVNFLRTFVPILKENGILGGDTTANFDAGFMPAMRSVPSSPSSHMCAVARQRADFIPVILLPSSASAILQVWNIREFVESGRLVDAHRKFTNEADGATMRRDAEEAVTAGPGSLINFDEFRVKFRLFSFVDDPSHVENWDHVCACIVTGSKWQFDGWFNGDKSKVEPSILFSELRGFLPFFDDDKPPPQKDQWNVVPLQLTRKTTTASTTHLRAVRKFWEELYKFLDSHPRFRRFTAEAACV